MNEHFKLMVEVIGDVVLFVSIPLLILLCVNTLGCAIPYTFQTWAACLGLIVMYRYLSKDRG